LWERLSARLSSLQAAPTEDFTNEMWVGGSEEKVILKKYKLKARIRQEAGL
jgi:hypothetical protein